MDGTYKVIFMACYGCYKVYFPDYLYSIAWALIVSDGTFNSTHSLAQLTFIALEMLISGYDHSCSVLRLDVYLNLGFGVNRCRTTTFPCLCIHWRSLTNMEWVSLSFRRSYTGRIKPTCRCCFDALWTGQGRMFFLRQSSIRRLSHSKSCVLECCKQDANVLNKMVLMTWMLFFFSTDTKHRYVLYLCCFVIDFFMLVLDAVWSSGKSRAAFNSFCI